MAISSFLLTATLLTVAIGFVTGLKYLVVTLRGTLFKCLQNVYLYRLNMMGLNLVALLKSVKPPN